MKKIFIYLAFCFVSSVAFGQSITLQPNTGNIGNLLVKSTGGTYGNISTTGPSGADLWFRLSEGSGNGALGTPIGRIATYINKFSIYSSNPIDLTLGVDGNDYLFIKPSGNIGIGTLTPAAKLDVAGTTNISGITTTTGESLPMAVSVLAQFLRR